MVDVFAQTASISVVAHSPYSPTGVVGGMPVAIIEVAFATQPMATTPTWTDITEYVDPPLVITRGRTDEFSQVQPSTLSMVLDNSDGRFTMGYSGSPYFPNVKIGKRIRVTVVYNGVLYRRFDGHVNQWPLEWTVAGTPSYNPVTVTATDRLKRFGQIGELESVLEEEILRDCASINAAYYPLDEPDGSIVISNSTMTPQAAGRIIDGGPGPIQFGSGTGPGTDEQSAAMFEPSSATAGEYLAVDLTTEIGTTTAKTLGIWFRREPNTNGRTMVSLQTASGSEVRLRTDSTNHLHALNYSAVTNAMNYELFSTNTVNTGTHFAVITESRSGGTVTARLYLDGTQVDTTTYAAFVMPSYSKMYIGADTKSDGQFWHGTLSHVFGLSSTLGAARITTIYNAGANGLAGERTDQRIGRIADWIGIPAADRAFDAGDSTVGFQSTDGSQPLQAMQEAEETEAGVLFMSGSNLLTFHKRSRRFNPSVGLTLDAQLVQQVGPDLIFQGDDFGMTNDTTVERPREITVRASNQTSIDEYGLYRTSRSTIHDNDSQALSLAQWLVNTYGEPANRVPTISINLYILSQSHSSLTTTVLSSDISTMIRLTNLPTPPAPQATLDFFWEGSTETIDVATWMLIVNCSPVKTSGFWQLGTSGLSELGTTTKLAY